MNDDRRGQLLEILKQKKYVSISYLIGALHYSESTIRRDVCKLEKLGLIKRSPGGALFIKDELKENPLVLKAGINRKQKNYIAGLAIDLIRDYSTIFIDSSSTGLMLSRHLGQRRQLTVITTNMITAAELESKKNHDVYMPGGHVQDGMVEGTLTDAMLDAFQVDAAFVSCRGFDRSFGASEILMQEATLKRVVRNHAERLVLLADSSKIEKRFTFRSFHPKSIDALITDRPIAKDLEKTLDENGIDCLY